MRTMLMIILCIFAYENATASEQNSIILKPEKQYNLAQKLFEEKEYLAAANEFIRFMYLFPDNKKIAEAQYKTAIAYSNAGRTEDAIRHFKKLSLSDPQNQFSVSGLFKLSELYTKINKPGEALLVLRNLLIQTRDNETQDKICFILGWLMLDYGDQIMAGTQQKINPFEHAQRYFSQISEQGKKKYNINALINKLERIDKIKHKNPKLAGALAIIPGAGFLYCERYRDALVSFLLNSALIIASYKSFQNNNPYLGGAIAFFETGFYAGNIYGSITSAHKYNKNRQDKYIEQLKEQYVQKQNDQKFPTLSFQSREKSFELGLIFNYGF
jgi:tetratricopeptide (TPR) repeat protein